MLSRVPYFLISEIPGTYFLISVFLDKRNFGAARCWRSFRVARFAVQSLLPAGGLYVAAAASGGGGGGSDGGGSGISDGMAGRARTWRTQRVYRHRRPDAFLLSFIKVTCEPFLNLKI